MKSKKKYKKRKSTASETLNTKSDKPVRRRFRSHEISSL